MAEDNNRNLEIREKQMQKKILEYMREYHMAEEGDCILAAVSGGADSLCLLLILLELQKTVGFDVCVVHVEHGIRGADSVSDACFVENFCKERKVPCRVFHCNALEYARTQKLTVEEGARKLRYGFFDCAAREFGADKIAVAHNRNDCAETMLFHLVRGTGLKGMCGILPVRGKIIRPLLCAERKEIEAYLADVRQEFCQDKTNEALNYTRNKLRHQVFPVLEQINSQAVAHMNRMAILTGEVAELVEDLTREAEKQYVTWQGRGCCISGEVVKEKMILQKSLLYQRLSEAAGDSKDITDLHVQQLQELFGRQVGKRLEFPYNITAERVYEGIRLEKCEGKRAKKGRPMGKAEEIRPQSANSEEEETAAETQGDFLELQPDSDLIIPCYGYEIHARLFENNFQNEEIPKKMYTKWLDYDKIKGTMQFRTRREKDFLVISADGRRKKLKKYFVDEKIPRQKRDSMLLLADDSHILWVIGHRISEDVKVTEYTRRILEIQVDGGTVHE